MTDYGKTTELALEGPWIEPDSYVSYLNVVHVKLEFRNVSEHTLEVTKITCSFQSEDSLPRQEFSAKRPEIIKPNNRSATMDIPIPIGLELKAGTNSLVIDVEYTIDRSARKTTFSDAGYLIINPKHSPEKHFFLSHKDPENTHIASRLDHYLKKIGFIGYIAENDPKPGLDMWTEKIFPSIDDCVCMIVLWTDIATNSPKIPAEIEYAKEKRKRIIILAEKESKVPEIFVGTNEYIKACEEITDEDLVNLVNWIHDMYRQGKL